MTELREAKISQRHAQKIADMIEKLDETGENPTFRQQLWNTLALNGYLIDVPKAPRFKYKAITVRQYATRYGRHALPKEAYKGRLKKVI